MTADQRTLSLLVHGGSKEGKSSLAATSPLPILVLDVEGSWKFIPDGGYIRTVYGRPLRMVFWDPMREEIPVYDGTWDICHVIVHEWSTVEKVYSWLTQGTHEFQSVVIDSISEIQQRCKRQLDGTQVVSIFTGVRQMRIQDWGTLLSYMSATIRGFRDLALLPHLSIRVVVFVAETGKRDGKFRPSMEGGIRDRLPYYVDICGYLYTERRVDERGEPIDGIQRRLLVAPYPEFEAGSRTDLLPEVIDSPNITMILDTVYPRRSEETEKENT